MDMLQFHRLRWRRKGAEGGLRILEVEDLGVAVVGVVHPPKVGVLFQHGDLHLAPVVVKELSGDADPGAVSEGADLRFGVRSELLGDVFKLNII